MSARTGLRHGELSELLWGDIVLDEGNSHVRMRASISKNKKEARIPLIRELEILLAEFRPVSAGDADKVFVKGVPRCRTLKKDLEQAFYISPGHQYPRLGNSPGLVEDPVKDPRPVGQQMRLGLQNFGESVE